MEDGAKGLIERLKASPDWRERVVYIEHFPARTARYEGISLEPALEQALRRRGLSRFYSHQAEAIASIRRGMHTAVTTPTASGKSYIYLVPVWEKMLKGETAHALYLSPLKALAQDQRRLVEELGLNLAKSARVRAALYDGDTPSSARAKIRSAPPHLLLSNPDMVHLSLLPSHAAWSKFLEKLEYVILDEAHAYRGIFGSHVSGILRRLKRICARYGSAPKLIVTSATICNPEEFLSRLTAEKFNVISESGAPGPARTFALIKPAANTYTESCDLLRLALQAGLKTIVFTKARKITELLSLWLADRAPEQAGRVRAYRAGYLPEDRRVLERALASDELNGIISTSALELGIDIGGLDCCLLVGYPGTHLSTWQRAGRVGRGKRPALIFMVGMEDALDLYYLGHPREFFSRGPERLILDESNPTILKSHLVCAAAEQPLEPADERVFGHSMAALVGEACREGRLMESAHDKRWFSSLKMPQRHVNIRSTGESYLIEGESGEAMGSIDSFRVFRECHPQAIYLHAGGTYEIVRLDESARRVTAREISADHYTQPISTEETKVLAVKSSCEFGPGKLAFGDVRVTRRVVGYERKLVYGGGTLSEHSLQLPAQEFETQAVWLQVPYETQAALRNAKRDLMGSLHALEHALVALFPMFALCDRWDLGGISTPHHPDTGTAAVFIYDGVPGGVGLAKAGYDLFGDWLGKVAAHLAACPCEIGCPSCIHSPKCGSRNTPLDKAGALDLANAFVGPGARPGKSGAFTEQVPAAERRREGRGPVEVPAAPETLVHAGPLPGKPGHRIVFDLETQKLASEVGGWDHKRDMRMSVAVTYDIENQSFRDYMEQDVDALLQDLSQARLVIGFNIRNFDFEVLSAYASRARLDELPTLDLLEQIASVLKRRVRLDDLARATLGKAKLAEGTEAVRWFRERNFTKLFEYCRHDVLVTKELYEFGITNKHVLLPSIMGTVKLPVAW